MEDKKIKQQVEWFSQEWQSITMSYSDYARSVGITYTGLQILKYITTIENCTQKIICEKSFLPRQTINSIITGLYKAGLVELYELSQDRRIKSIHLTEKGKAYTSKIFSKINEAEYKAMASLSKEQRKILIDSISVFDNVFRETVFKNK